MRIGSALPVFCCLLQGTFAQVDISGCCTHLRIETTGEASTHQGNRIGEYRLTGVLADRPIYKNAEREEFLFYLQSNKKGLWMVGPIAGQFNGGLAHRGDTYCVEDVAANQWKYTDGSAWHVDSHLRVSCLDQTVTPQCLYNDQTEFVGGDLPQVFGGGGVETSRESSADCIEECEKRAGCKYWTWIMGEKVNCFLKNNKLETVRNPKYVSGSIPKACTSTPSTPTQAPSTYSVCTYNNLDFHGGDLFAVLAEDVDDCRRQCEEHVSCQLFTFDKNLERGCYFKTDQVTVRDNDGVISGATAEICEDFILPHVAKKNEEPVFNEKEVNGKFKITSLRWDEKLNDPNSQEYLDLSNTIEDSIESMLRSERDLDEQAEFSVKVQKFRQGSVVCDFKVNYILKEAYVAIPFAIKPSNITDAMSKNFKFKKGILFQRFLIAAGSFNSSAPVDHCAAKGCSHKCDYDYDVEDYLCTCPRSLLLDNSGKTCVTPEEAATEETIDNTTDATTKDTSDEEGTEEDATTQLPEVKLTLLPSDCLWSPWSDWTPCSSSCGAGKMERQRSVVLPEKNGGACPGRFKEVVECSVDCGDEQENNEAESNNITDSNSIQTTTASNDEEIDEIMNEVVTESVEENDIESVTKQQMESSSKSNETEADIEETVTKSAIIGNSEEGSGINSINEQTTVGSRNIEEIVTILPNIIEEEEEEIITKNNNEKSAGEDIIKETSTEVSRENNETNQQTTTAAESDKLDDSFGRKITTEGSELTTVEVNELETTTVINMKTKDSEIENGKMEGITNDEDTRIVFPLSEDVEIITTTNALDQTEIPDDLAITTEHSDEIKPETQYPSTSVDMMKETTTESVNQEMSTISFEGKKQDNDEDEYEITTQELQEGELAIDQIDADPNIQIESTTEIPYEAETETTIDYQDNVENRSQSQSTTMKDLNNDKDHEYETTTHINKDSDENKMDNETSSKTIENETEVTTSKRENLGDSSEPQTTSSPEDNRDDAQTISKETDESGADATTAADMTGDDGVTEDTMAVEIIKELTTTGIDSHANGVPTKAPRFDIENEQNEEDVSITQEADEITTLNPKQIDAEDTETTTVAVISIEETDDVITIVTTAKPMVKAEEEQDTTNTEKIIEQTTASLIDEESPMEKDDASDITNTIQSDTDDIIDQTTLSAINVEIPMVKETSDSDVTTTTQSNADDIIDQTTVSAIEVEIPMVKETSDTEITTTTQSDKEDVGTTTPSSEYGDHEFLCKESAKTDADSDVPLECVLTNGEDERTVVIVIPRDSLGGDREKLFNKNVKIVVKDFMVMERSPRSLS